MQGYRWSPPLFSTHTYLDVMTTNLLRSAALLLFGACPLLMAAQGCQTLQNEKETYIEKHVTFEPNATLEQKLDVASRLVPTHNQKEWQELELTAFIHFGINTYTGREWGDGTEDPKIFNPQELDTDQWVSALKEGGFKMVILTAKHHDGFCLWPTQTTDYSVKSSPWRNGEGDVMAELRKSCDKYGLKLGVYLSPWDRNAKVYGEGQAYNDMYIQQLRELLSNYGKIDEVWFDGANGEGPNGKKQEYDFDRILATVHELQPEAVTAIMGDDVRWVGNETGLGRATEWSATAFAPHAYSQYKDVNKNLGIKEKTPDLGSRELLAKAEQLFWYPSEVDVSIRPGWFYHEAEDAKVKTLQQLTHIYFNSVGMNSVLLLNIPPMPNGKLSEIDVQRLREFGQYIDKLYDHDFVTNEGDLKLNNDGTATIEATTEAQPWDVICLQEDIEKGQRIESFTVEAESNGEWKEIAKGTTIGYKRLLPLDTPVTTNKIRVTITSYRGKRPHLDEVKALRRPQ